MALNFGEAIDVMAATYFGPDLRSDMRDWAAMGVARSRGAETIEVDGRTEPADERSRVLIDGAMADIALYFGIAHDAEGYRKVDPAARRAAVLRLGQVPTHP